MKKNTLDRWSCLDAAELYGIHDWSAGYFKVSEQGEVVVKPRGPHDKTTISLMDVVSGIKARGIDMPVLLRFCDILESRVALINNTFGKAIKDAGFKGCYRGVYPLKVNQQQHVLEEIVEVGRRYHHGLEVGSKAELIAAMAYLDDPKAYLVCNGYKDEEFINLALFAVKLGLRVILVVEMPSEVSLIMDCADKLGITPRIGVRIKLSSRAGGHWSDSAGDLSVFGLNASQVIDMLDQLRKRDRLSCLKMLHYHLGSQISNIRRIRTGIQEACRYYVDMVREGAALEIIDIGGGLAVDYDGSHTNFPSSSNYGIREYCDNIIDGIMSVLDEENIPHPIIISESGRAVVAYHSVLLFNVLESGRIESYDLPKSLPDNAHEVLHSLLGVNDFLTSKNLQECFHDATYYRDEIRDLFLHGGITLRERALAEQIFWHIAIRIAQQLKNQKYVPDEMTGLSAALSDIYYGNFSVFQSLPDVWAIDQLFPIMPIHRLCEAPHRDATLSDITCDCDGKIDKFTDLHDVKKSLPLHELNNEDYYLGVFLAGAYQETLGDLHNLLGDTNVVGIHVGENGGIEFSREIIGDSVADVLSYVEYDPKDMINRVKRIAEKSVLAGRLTPLERRIVVGAYEDGLRGYTYYEQQS